ncbi:MAG: 16S rRNA (guanine(966)-N(2))-methyltransferase RsmD [Gemmatimonadota bacterium]|jgi:16S rRNA (guanine966-N2)-methyltransferase
MRIIAGRWRGHTIQAPPGRATRPTTDRVREAWMSAMQQAIPGAQVLDLFAGSGALGLETLSRGAAHVTFVEQSGGALRALRANIRRLEAAPTTRVVRADALRYAEKLPVHAFDLAVADPPYGHGHAQALLHCFARTPFARWLWVEHGRKEVLPTLPGLRTRTYGDTALTSIPAPT